MKPSLVVNVIDEACRLVADMIHVSEVDGCKVFDLERSEERLDRRIVPAVALSTHALPSLAEDRDERTVSLRGIL